MGRALSHTHTETFRIATQAYSNCQEPTSEIHPPRACLGFYITPKYMICSFHRTSVNIFSISFSSPSLTVKFPSHPACYSNPAWNTKRLLWLPAECGRNALPIVSECLACLMGLCRIYTQDARRGCPCASPHTEPHQRSGVTFSGLRLRAEPHLYRVSAPWVCLFDFSRSQTQNLSRK